MKYKKALCNKYLVYLPNCLDVEYINARQHKLDFILYMHNSLRTIYSKTSCVFWNIHFKSLIYICSILGLLQILSLMTALKQFLFYFQNFIWRVFKAHGINMRLIKRRLKSRYFLRVGFGHGYYLPRNASFSVKVYRKRYFMVGSFDKRIFEFFSYHLRFLRRFFRYKLIGVKFKRDSFKIKVGKKKTF